MLAPCDRSPTVSVIVPVFNGAQFVSTALQSVLRQSYRDFEVVVVNDGSTDDTVQVLEQFGDSIRCIHQNNQGPSAARNTGIRQATGCLIALLDADDIWLPEFLEKMVFAIRRNPRLEGAYCAHRFMDRAGHPLKKIVMKRVNPRCLYRTLRGGNFIQPSTTVIYRNVYQQCGLFDEDLTSLEDWDMWMRISQTGLLGSVDQALVLYRQHGANSLKNLSRLHRDYEKVVAKHFGPLAEEMGKSPKVTRAAYADIYRYQAVGFLQIGDYLSSAKNIQKVFELLPESVNSLDEYYALACAHQSLEFRGGFDQMDLERAEHDLLEVLDILYSSLLSSDFLYHNKRQVYAHANFTLALLMYGSGLTTRARSYLMRAANLYPRIVTKRAFAWTLGMSFLR